MSKTCSILSITWQHIALQYARPKMTALIASRWWEIDETWIVPIGTEAPSGMVVTFAQGPGTFPMLVGNCLTTE